MHWAPAVCQRWVAQGRRAENGAPQLPLSAPGSAHAQGSVRNRIPTRLGRISACSAGAARQLRWPWRRCGSPSRLCGSSHDPPRRPWFLGCGTDDSRPSCRTCGPGGQGSHVRAWPRPPPVPPACSLGAAVLLGVRRPCEQTQLSGGPGASQASLEQRGVGAEGGRFRDVRSGRFLDGHFFLCSFTQSLHMEPLLRVSSRAFGTRGRRWAQPLSLWRVWPAWPLKATCLFTPKDPKFERSIPARCTY